MAPGTDKCRGHSEGFEIGNPIFPNHKQHYFGKPLTPKKRLKAMAQPSFVI